METTVEYDATKTLSELLKRVDQGERITTKNGVPVAAIKPPVANEKPAVAEAIAAIKELSQGIALALISRSEK